MRSGETLARAFAISSAEMRIGTEARSSLSNRRVYSTRAASPRVRTSARMAATAAPTSASDARFRSRNAVKRCSKSAAEASSRSGIEGGPETFDPATDPHRLGLEGGPIDDQPRGDLRDLLDLDEPVRLQGRTGGDEVDDAAAEAEAGGQLHRPVELDAFRLHAAGGEVSTRHFGVFGRDPDMAPPPGIVVGAELRRLRDHESATADAEVDRGVYFPVV